MTIDLVMPNGNEQDFIDMAKRLGYTHLCFIYESAGLKDAGISRKIENVSSFNSKGISISSGVLCKPKEIEKFRQQVDIVMCRSGEDDRQILERSRPDILFGLEYSPRSDFIHNKNSGLNQVLAKIAEKNNITIGLELSSFIGAKDSLKVRLIPRISQNVTLCRKYKCGMACFSLARSPFMMSAPKDMVALLIHLGMSPDESKSSMRLLEQNLRE